MLEKSYKIAVLEIHTAGDNLNAPLYVRLYTNRFHLERILFAHILVAYAKLRRIPLVVVNTGEGISYNDYIEKTNSGELPMYSVHALIAPNVTASVAFMNDVESREDWMTIRKLSASEGTVRVEIE